jgi:hypothetical protein
MVLLPYGRSNEGSSQVRVQGPARGVKPFSSLPLVEYTSGLHQQLAEYLSKAEVDSLLAKIKSRKPGTPLSGGTPGKGRTEAG